jgi:hypothetical protein
MRGAAHHRPSRAQRTAGCSGFFVLIQHVARPVRYGASIRFETISSRSMRQAAANTVAPSASTCSLMAIPPDWRASNFPSRVLRSLKGRGRRSSPSCCRRCEPIQKMRQNGRAGASRRPRWPSMAWVASPVKGGPTAPPPAADGLDRACHPAFVCHQAFDGEERLKPPANAMPIFSRRHILYGF